MSDATASVVAARAPALGTALNAEQTAAVMHGDAPLLVVAGAGTGKTFTLAARVARLVMDGADPQRLLLLTFSRRAAQEMTARAGRLLHQALGLRATQPAPVLPWAGTFHAIGARLLREHADQVGLPAHFIIIDRGDAQDLMALQRQALGRFARCIHRGRAPGIAQLGIAARPLHALHHQAPGAHQVAHQGLGQKAAA